nr:adhesion G-protein coupled receptor G5 isoform X1 [Nothobranchius furzeri]XP_054597508.1 adhesion G-protein coupled receptor G5 isoform X1 [Nothobranchius furzeri]
MLKNMLFITNQTPLNSTFPSDVVYHDQNKTQLCFNISSEPRNTVCCSKNFNCNAKIELLRDNVYHLTLNETTLSMHDVVVLQKATFTNSCLPSRFYNSTGLILHLLDCLKTGEGNIRLSQDGLCGQNTTYDETTCKELTNAGDLSHVIKLDGRKKTCVFCKLPGSKPEVSLTLNAMDAPVKPQEATNVMKKLGSVLTMMGNSSTAAVKIGNITGVVAKLPQLNPPSLNFGFAGTGDVNILEEQTTQVGGFFRTIQIPKEATEMAVKKNGLYAGVLLFPNLSQKDGSSSSIFNNEILGIEMGAEISNLSDTIDIRYSSMNTSGFSAVCSSWNGKGSPNWTTDGCQTVEVNGSITCQCTHLTFFAILMSPTPTNISATVYKTLTKITEAGCGVSMFFLGAGLFMHFLIRKTKSSNATTILINLFIALFALNFCFLINKTIADLKNDSGCVAMAAFLHYSMLATFTWFSMQALHLYISLRKLSANTKHYIYKICITGWVTPAVVIIALLAAKKYGNIVIQVDDGTSENMCWIPDSSVHVGLNVGYYAIVFLFTFSIFSITVMQILHFKSKPVQDQEISASKTKFLSILGLFFLLGISWAFAFFSYGPLLIPSFYIFTILNSFQGFLLFIYYYHSTKITPEANSGSRTGSSSTPTVAENIYTASSK